MVTAMILAHGIDALREAGYEIPAYLAWICPILGALISICVGGIKSGWRAYLVVAAYYLCLVALWDSPIPCFFVLLGPFIGFAIICMTTFASHKTSRKAKQNEIHCAYCGYDLRGNQSGICPECGRWVPVHQKRRTG